jgi:hypothetical protein
MTLDPHKLRNAAKRLQKAAPRRTGSGPTEAVRGALVVIRELRQQNVTWNAIAEALAEQGVVQANGKRLRASGLTSIVFQIERQERQRAQKSASRERPDTAREPAPAAQKLKLSRDLAPSLSSLQQPPQTEDELRDLAYQKLQAVLKKE